MIFSLYLKSIWQEPLPLWIKSDTWAFPSGHMLFTVSFYGWMAFELRKKWLGICAGLIIVGVAWALMHFGYHGPRDIWGAIGFGALTLVAYYFLLQVRLVKENLPLLGLFLSPLTALFICWVPKYFAYAYEAQGQLMGFSLGWFLWNKYCKKELIKSEKSRALLLSFLGAAVFMGLGFLTPKTRVVVLLLSLFMGVSISFPGFGLICRKRKP